MFAKYLLKKKWHILGFVLLSIMASVMMSLFSLHIADVFTAAEVSDYERVVKLLILMYAWYIFIRLMDYYAELYGVYIVNAVRRDIKNDMFDAVISKNLSAFAERNSGEYISEFTNDITMIETKYLIPMRELLTYIITIVTTSSVILTIDIRMALVLIIGTILCLLLPFITSKYTSRQMLQFLERFDTFIQYLKDVFNALFLFKNYAVESEVANQFEKENADVEKKKYNAELAQVIVNNLVGRLAWFVPLLVVILGLQGVINGSLAVSSVLAAYLLAGELGMPLQSIGHRVGMIRSMRGLENKISAMKEALVDQITGEYTTQCTTAMTAKTLHIAFQDVGLSIHNKTILKNISLSFEPGKKYLIIGRNGSGKSTSAKLLKHIYPNYTGEIILNGMELRTPEGKLLSESISYSNENVLLLSDTVRNNILLFREISEEQLVSAVKKACLRVPLERVVGDNGKFLSSGERRKLEIARVIVTQPQVLIFDEVVSTLDIETAYEIEKLILSLDSTVIMISNAFSGQLLAQYDGIILMDEGCVLATGSHDDLLDTSPEYREIYEIRCGKIEKGDQ